MSKGVLYLIPSSLSEDNSAILPASTLELLFKLKSFVVEEERTARRFLKNIHSPVPQTEFQFTTLNEHTDRKTLPEIISRIRNGMDMGLLSEAGCPGIADPGSDLISLAHQEGIQVIPLVGPSSILLSLMASGLNGQSFCFHGYLPVESKSRQQKIRELEKIVLKSGQSQIFIETPYRNLKLLADLLSVCHDDLKLCIAVSLTSKDEYIKTLTIKDWKKLSPDLHKKPAVFILGV